MITDGLIVIRNKSKPYHLLADGIGCQNVTDQLQMRLVGSFGGINMKPILSCEFNMDTACVELRFLDGTMLAIDTIAVENEVTANMFERSELDYLIYNDPIGYADLILNGDPEAYLRQVTDYHPLDS